MYNLIVDLFAPGFDIRRHPAGRLVWAVIWQVGFVVFFSGVLVIGLVNEDTYHQTLPLKDKPGYGACVWAAATVPKTEYGVRIALQRCETR